MNSGQLYLGGVWREGRGEMFASRNPMTQDVIWQGRAAHPADVDAAVSAARAAQPLWFRNGWEARIQVLRRFQTAVRQARSQLAERVSDETGKPHWEALQEVDTLIAKTDHSLAAQAERAGEKHLTLAGFRGVLRHRPHGVLAVLGPFNLPAHLPHSHLIPALLAGNAVVFKPSEFTPGTAELCARLWEEAGLPAGVLNLVPGGRETGEALARAAIDGLLFTGSHRAGVALNRLFVETPGKILALELGGNNPLVVWEPADLVAAAELIVASAYITSGQRCTCARRLIVPAGPAGEAMIAALIERIGQVTVGGAADRPEPYLGPLIHAAAADALLAAEARLRAAGGRPLVPLTRSDRSAALLTPGLIDVTDASDRPDEEFFGPLLQVMRVRDFDAAIAAANATRFGLSAGLISAHRDLWDRVVAEVRAGVINWNRPLTGASGQLPFGGLGESGNHRPGAWTAADYCQDPVASLEADPPDAPPRF